MQGDIVVADSDGVVVVPQGPRPRKCSALAQQMDFKEHSMYPVIEQMKSIVEAVKKVWQTVTQENRLRKIYFHQTIRTFILFRFFSDRMVDTPEQRYRTMMPSALRPRV